MKIANSQITFKFLDFVYNIYHIPEFIIFVIYVSLLEFKTIIKQF